MNDQKSSGFSKFGKLFGRNQNIDKGKVVEEQYTAPSETSSPTPLKSQKKRKEKRMADSGKTGDLNTIIGKGTVIEGIVKVQNSLRLDGKIEGKIMTTDSLIVGKNGEFDGEIRARNAIIAGHVKGQVFASGKVVLEENSITEGEIKTAKLSINDGAQFDGTCQMTEGGGIKQLSENTTTMPQAAPRSSSKKRFARTVEKN